jgi:hypothetical protein
MGKLTHVTEFCAAAASQGIMERLVRARISGRDRSSKRRRHENARR